MRIRTVLRLIAIAALAIIVIPTTGGGLSLSFVAMKEAWESKSDLGLVVIFVFGYLIIDFFAGGIMAYDRLRGRKR